ncbi:MAG: Hsp33 family molecular chaperone HslO [Tenericutes bacterium]|jgi:molecular chaperone Hsp33|nr:Hsp33 family molecular chaperone HslO [Mycoplasmatota bacterium]
MNDYLVKAYAFSGTVRIYAADTTNLVEEARQIHQTYPAASAAFGRLLTTSLIMGAMYSENQVLTIRVDGGGPIGKMITNVDAHGHVKGTVENPQVHYSYKDKLAVGMVVGTKGHIHVTKDLKIRDVFTSSSEIQTGEIAEDFTYYFAKSEQIPSSVGLGVLVNEKNEVFASGGFILQAMPGVKEETLIQIEKNIKEMKPISELIDSGMTPEQLVNEITKGDHEFVEEMELSYHCDCHKERFAQGISTLDNSELDSIIGDNEPIEVTCQFCKKTYNFTIDDIKKIKLNK